MTSSVSNNYCRYIAYIDQMLEPVTFFHSANMKVQKSKVSRGGFSFDVNWTCDIMYTLLSNMGKFIYVGTETTERESV